MNPLTVINLIGGIAVGVVMLVLVMGFGEVFYHEGDLPETPGYVVEMDPSLAVVKTSIDEAAGAAPIEEVDIDVVALVAEADIAKGAKLVKKKCALCHHVVAAKGHHTGPNLYGILGRDIASMEGFDYSDAIIAQEGGWDEKKLYSFLIKPKAFIPGTKMAFAGFKKEKDRVNVIAYLSTLK